MATDIWQPEIPEPQRWAEGIGALGYVDGDGEYGCGICRRGPAQHFRFLTVGDHLWYATGGYTGILCRPCALGMGRVHQVKTLFGAMRFPLALPMAVLMLIHNAIVLRAGRSTLPAPEPVHEVADRIFEGERIWRRPAFLGGVAALTGLLLALAPSVIF